MKSGEASRMTREEVVKLFNRRHDAFKRRDAEALAADHAKDGVLESPMAGGTVNGREAIARIYRGLFAGFPDLAIDWSDLVIDGDRVVEMGTMSGTDTGGFMGLPPTGKSFGFPIALILTLEDGRIAHERRVYDFTGMLVQIGLLKAKPA
jgi:steroid delta-isomerase-like uncharacterized protein